jgi:hypothetical protein
MSAFKNIKFIVCLPTTGQPFIWKNKMFNTSNKDGRKNLNDNIRDCVGGDAERFKQGDSQKMLIHPMFQEERKRWSIANTLLRDEDNTEVYVNENGVYQCGINVACLMLHKDIMKLARLNGGMVSAEDYRKAPLKVREAPFSGNIALVVSVRNLKTVCDPDVLKLVKVSTHFPLEDAGDGDELEDYVFEPEDENDIIKMKALCKEHNWAFDNCGGVVYQMTAGNDEEDPLSEDESSDEED